MEEEYIKLEIRTVEKIIELLSSYYMIKDVREVLRILASYSEESAA